MKRVLSSDQIRAADQLTTEQYGIPGLLLMENAAHSVVAAIEQQFGRVTGKRFAVLCGKGNNGGDGAAIARQLWLKDARADVFLIGELSTTNGDARTNFEIVSKLSAIESGVSDAPIQSSAKSKSREQQRGSLSFREIGNETQLFALSDLLLEFDFIVDALVGTGLVHSVSGRFASLIERLSDFDEAKIIAVDLPSGLHADKATPIGPHVKAGLTVTMTAAKPGNVLAPAAFANGALVIVPIGTPQSVIDEAGARLYLVEQADIETYLQQTTRGRGAHKGSEGRVLVVAGSQGKTGAACLTAEAALRAGCGLVTLATAASSQQVVARRSIAEVMTDLLDETPAGTIATSALGHAKELTRVADIVAVGPGISTHDETRAFVAGIVQARLKPMVIDADGLNCLSPWPEDLRGSRELPLILTPHPGEMARLAGVSSETIIEIPVETARAFATAHGVILVLKGARTVIASSDGAVYVNSTGNPGMATGGTGDVLTGIIAGLFAQSPQNALGAAIAGVYLHGLAGDLAKKQKGERALLASDITTFLVDALRKCGG